ncbi:hydroxyproline-rich glycoprotein [Hibiscus syriacus]|uniref:Hydroxyproline-rich glycoprotein n=1 Tax=Hibiscus syriacus TaxID=106335 RepID=A0A6A3ACR7_HIBSY|nr:protein BIG GRAIN 1-like A [Hibiscus syriacus]KAE8700712.1 hydroxyproline-rich glycoprotein [Hibiscus syriacus]
MDLWVKLPEQHRHRRENPSFSSTLLDSIYRSIDEPNGGGAKEDLIFYRKANMAKKHSNSRSLKDEEMTSLQRACIIERWMEKKGDDNKVVIRRKPMADSERISRIDFVPVLLNSSSSSSDSSSGGGFSSSESDSFHDAKSRSSSSSSSHYTSHRPKPIRTGVTAQQPEVESSFHDSTQQKPKHEGGFVRTKSKALKIYSDLKKVKQPISPGGKLASFLNALFTAGNIKNTKISSSKSDQATPACSSASSFSRSCLSKTPSSRGNGTKRSVRFCPVNDVILDDENIGHENDHQTQTSIASKPTSKELEFRIMEENRRVVEAAKELLNSYHKKKEEYHMRDICNVNEVSADDEDDDDDTASYASSDLFELNNLSAIGIDRYREELPVYETTRLDTNRAIANGLIV